MFSRAFKKLDKFLVAIPIFLALLVLAININKPFIGQHDFNGVQEGTIARNYLEHGFLNLKFGQITGHISDVQNAKGFYTSYLPTLSVLVALSFSIFGIVEWAARIVPAIFSLIGVAFLFFLVERLWNKKAAFFACVFYTLNPMFIYYGNMPVFDIPILAMMIVSIYFYILWIESQKKKDLILLCLSLFLGGLLGWIIDYLGPLFILHAFLIRKLNFKILIPSFVLSFALFLQFLHAHILTGSLLGGNMFISLKTRLAGAHLSFGGEDFTLYTYIRKEISWFQSYFTRTLLFLSFIYSVYILRLKLNIQKATLLILLILGLAHPIIFSKAVFIHDYQNIYILPFLSISGALGLDLVYGFLLKFKIDKRICFVAIVGVLITFSLERIEFTKALLRSDMDRPGRDMAKIINNLQTKPFEVAIISPRFASFYGLFTDFYSKYQFSIINEDYLKQKDSLVKFKYIIMIDEDIRDFKLYENLKKEFPFKKEKDLTIITFHE